jgi:hypothetical protein
MDINFLKNLVFVEQISRSATYQGKSINILLGSSDACITPTELSLVQSQFTHNLAHMSAKDAGK